MVNQMPNIKPEYALRSTVNATIAFTVLSGVIASGALAEPKLNIKANNVSMIDLPNYKRHSKVLTTSKELQKELTPMIENIHSFKSLEQGWNGYDSDPVDHELITHSISFIKEFFAGVGTDKVVQFKVFPTARDSIQIEIGRSTKKYLEVEISLDSNDIYVEYPDGRYIEQDGLTSDGVIKIAREYFNT